MNYEAYEPEIDLKDLFFHILYRWRSILIMGCVFCLLLGGYKAMRNLTAGVPEAESKSEYKQELAMYDLAMAQYALDKDVYKLNLETYERWLEQQKTYRDKSVLMHTDPYNKPVASAEFFVRLDDSEWERLPNNENLSLDPANSVIRAYIASFYSVIDWEPLEKLTGVTRLYLMELIYISSDYSSDTFTIGIVYSDGDTAQKILDEITGQILDSHQAVADNVAAHTLTVLCQSLSYMIDDSLAISQKSNADTINAYEQNIIDCQIKLEELEEPKAPEAPEAPEAVSVVSGLVKYLILGAVVGIFLMAGFYGVRYLLSGVVHTDRDLKERFGYQMLGSFARPDRKGALSFIDRLLERMEGIRVKPSDAVVCQCIAANIANLAGDKKNLLLTGTVSSEQLEKIAKGIALDLKELKLQVMDNMNRNPETLKQLTQCDGVVLVEQRNTSKYAEVQMEQELTTALKVPVVGYIMLR